MTCEDAQIYFTELLQGKLEEGFEYQIKAHLSQCAECREFLEEVESTWEEMKKTKLVEPDSSLKMGFYSMLQQYKEEEETSIMPILTGKTRSLSNLKWIGIAASVTLIFFAGYLTSQLIDADKETTTTASKKEDGIKKGALEESISSEKNVKEKNELVPANENTKLAGRNEVGKSENSKDVIAYNNNTVEESINHPEFYEDEEAVVVESDKILSNQARSKVQKTTKNSDDRIAFIYASTQSNNDKDKIINVLIDALLKDPNPNVRIAAIDALEKIALDVNVQNRIAGTLTQQESPTVQMATIDLILKYNIKKGNIVLKEFLKRNDLDDSVKEYAKEALRLIS